MSKLVWERVEEVWNLAYQNNIELISVSTQEWIEGNENANKIAMRGAKTEFFGQEPALGITKCLV